MRAYIHIPWYIFLSAIAVLNLHILVLVSHVAKKVLYVTSQYVDLHVYTRISHKCKNRGPETLKNWLAKSTSALSVVSHPPWPDHEPALSPAAEHQCLLAILDGVEAHDLSALPSLG